VWVSTLLGIVAVGVDAGSDAVRAIRSIAGTGQPGLAGDGGAAARAQLSLPLGLAVDGAGDLYVTDAGNHRIRRITAKGLIATVAGSGATGYLEGSFAGDGGPGTEAELNVPSAVAIGPGSALIVADTRNNRVRKLEPGGTIVTVAGNGTEGFGGDGGAATDAELDFPSGLAVDRAGNIYIADTNNHRVRKVTPTGIITTVAGSGPTGYLAGGFAGDGGPATAARLSRPFGLALGPAGHLYIADGFNNRIRTVTHAGIITTVAGSGATGYLQGGFAGDGGPALSARLNFPRAVQLDATGNLYIADALNHRVRQVRPDGTMVTIAGSGPTGYLKGGFAGDGGRSTEARLAFPTGLALARNGTLYVADGENHRIRAVTLPSTRR
jgi:sugar lactone lactonase YvrE